LLIIVASISALCGSRPYELDSLHDLPDIASAPALPCFTSVLPCHFGKLLYFRAAPADQSYIVIPVPSFVVALVKWRSTAAFNGFLQLFHSVALFQSPSNVHLALSCELRFRVPCSVSPIVENGFDIRLSLSCRGWPDAVAWPAFSLWSAFSL